MVDPALLVLGGGIGSRPELLSPVRGWLAKLMPNPLAVETSKLGNRASMIGALAAALRQAHQSLFAARPAVEPLTLPTMAAAE